MVFMGVAHVEGTAAALSQHAEADIGEMRRIFADGRDVALKLFVQRHGIGTPTREWIRPGSQPGEVPLGERSAADGNALRRFMIWALTQTTYQPGDVLVLILWGHAYHFALGHTETPTGIAAVDFEELRAVLSDFQLQAGRELGASWADRAPEPGARKPLDVLAFDACDLATIEVAHHLSPFADYMIASQIGVPLPGWPYDKILGRLVEASGARPMGPAEFGAFAVRQFCEHYQGLSDGRNAVPVSLTLLDLTKAPAVFHAAERLAGELAWAAGGDGTELMVLQELFFRSQTMPGRPFIDVADFCLNLSRCSAVEGVRRAAAALGDLLVRPPAAGGGDRARGAFIVEHSRTAHSTARLHGASLYAPQITTTDWRGPRFFYTKFSSSRESSWSRLVHTLAEGS